MKKAEKVLLALAFIISFAILFTSCEKDDVECKCDLEVFIFGQEGSYTITGVPTDCNGNYDRDSLPLGEGHIPGSLKNCD